MPPASKPASPRPPAHTFPHPSSFLEYLSSSLIVVQVHQPPCILFDFSGINKPPGELNAVSDIRRAASPLPALLLVVVALFLSVTATIAEVALAAGGRDSVCNPGSSNGIGERSFPASCGEKPKADGLAERQHLLKKVHTSSTATVSGRNARRALLLVGNSHSYRITYIFKMLGSTGAYYPR